MIVDNIHLEPKWRELVAEVLRRHIPGKAVWAFGSRATGRRVKRFSDLDLAVEGRLDSIESYGLEEDFDESSLPIKVDVVQLGAVTPEFRARIEKDFVLVHQGSARPQSADALPQEQVPA